MKIPTEIINFSLNIKENISSKQAGKKWRLFLSEIFYSKHIEINFHFKSLFLFPHANVFLYPSIEKKVAVSSLAFKGRWVGNSLVSTIPSSNLQVRVQHNKHFLENSVCISPSWLIPHIYVYISLMYIYI